MPVLTPICFMKRTRKRPGQSRSFLIFRIHPVEEAGKSVKASRQSPVLVQIAKILQNLNNKGFIQLGTQGNAFRLHRNGMVILDKIENLFRCPSLPFIKEYLWAQQIRRFFHNYSLSEKEKNHFLSIYLSSLDIPGLSKKWITHQIGVEDSLT